MVSSWLLALLSLSAADGLRGGAMAGGPLLKSGAQSQCAKPVTPRAVVVLRGGGARRLRSLHCPEPEPEPTPTLRLYEPGIATQWARYLQALEEKPMVTKMATAAFLAGTIAQPNP